MRTVVGVDSLEPPVEGSAITIGTFDGVHLGHRALIARTLAVASERGMASVIVTWDRHPAATLRPDKMPPMLTTPERKIELLSERGADLLVVLPFDEELSRWSPERFVSDVLVKGLGVKLIVVGKDWRFGRGAKGDVPLLRDLGAELGFEVDGVELEALGDSPVSSSRVRRAIGDGDMELARTLLGRPFDVDGVVVRGDDRGKALGYPTANVALPDELANPPRGVYAGRARVREAWHTAATNIGVNPTFGGDPATTRPRVETYLVDFAEDIYGESIRVELWRRLRDEQKFASAEALIDQMAADVAATRALIDPAP